MPDMFLTNLFNYCRKISFFRGRKIGYDVNLLTSEMVLRRWKMKKTLSVKLDSKFYNQLELIANKKGVSKSFLVRKKLESLLSESDELDNLTLFNLMTLALQKKSPFRLIQIGAKLNWSWPNRNPSGFLLMRQ